MPRPKGSKNIKKPVDINEQILNKKREIEELKVRLKEKESELQLLVKQKRETENAEYLKVIEESGLSVDEVREKLLSSSR